MNQQESGLSFERVVFFSDAVFAIVITLLVLELKPPHLEELSDTALNHALLGLLPKFIGFVISFVIVGLMWIEHHRIFRYINDYDAGLLWRNLLMLLFLCLLLGGTVWAERSRPSASRDDSTQVFWQKFKAAVSKADTEAVASLSRFPIRMSYGLASIKNKAQLRRRYREIFNQQTNAAVCFTKAKLEMEAGNPKRFTVACPDAAGNEVVIYHFEQTKSGWKFTALDNLNE